MQPQSIFQLQRLAYFAPTTETGLAFVDGAPTAPLALVLRDANRVEVVDSLRVLDASSADPSPASTPGTIDTESKEIRLTSMPHDTAAVNSIVRDWKSSDAILGFEWTFNNECICIASTGIEFYT
eukprot:jgi/Hompol1/5691/HPOL_000818-RA